MTTLNFLIQKTAIQSTQWQETADAPLADGEVRVRIETFALTSNNITYAAFGDAMNYWKFFPAPAQPQGAPADAPAMGVIPVWGFATVTQTSHPGVAVGERLYGYYPMANSVVLKPGRVTVASFYDTAPHRAELHGVYNQYMRCNVDPFYTPATEGLQALLRPLFVTAWLIDDFFADNQFFGAGAVQGGLPGMALLSSASSKTAYATAFGLKQRAGIEVVGLTSAANVAFCESLGCYHRVVTYKQFETLPADRACVYVDFAGNADLRRTIHTRFVNLKYSCSIGGTHVEQLGGTKDLPGVRATLFFAPAQIKKRASDWGPEVFGQRMHAAWVAFLATATNPAAPWITVQEHKGRDAVAAAYALVLAGRGDPRLGHMLAVS